MVISNIEKLLKGREFITIATADNEGLPNAAPKFLLKYETPYLYIVDYAIAKTADNLRKNPRASLSVMDLHNLEGYRLNGTTELIEQGAEHERLAAELRKSLVRLSASRVIEGLQTGKRHEHFELEMPDRFVVIKFRIREAVKIGTSGDLYKETV